MSGKFENNKTKSAAKTPAKKARKKRRSGTGLKVAIVIVLILLCAMGGLFLFLRSGEEETAAPETTAAEVPETQQTTQPEVQLEEAEAVSFDLGNDLMITDLGAYTGIYMEDGSDEMVSGVMMIVVTNNGESTLQYAQVTLSGEAGDAVFSLSTLEPGASVVVLEANRREYSSGDSFTSAAAEHVVFFKEELSTHEDIFKIQTLDGGFNITNISDQDITGKIEIYYKNSGADMYYGGITYRGSIEGGMKAGEIKQVMSQHFSASGTTIMYITIAEE